jgi:hypothetical protein
VERLIVYVYTVECAHGLSKPGIYESANIHPALEELDQRLDVSAMPPVVGN